MVSEGLVPGNVDQAALLPHFGQARWLKRRKRNEFRSLKPPDAQRPACGLVIAPAIAFPKNSSKEDSMRNIIAAMALLWVCASSAEARAHRYHHHYHHHYSHGYSHAGRPAAWCGWFMRTQVGGDPGPQYNLARNWAHYGSNAGGPSVGAIVVWPHHVGKIVGQENGQWIVQSGNDGRGVRTRPRSLSGAIAFRTA